MWISVNWACQPFYRTPTHALTQSKLEIASSLLNLYKTEWKLRIYYAKSSTPTPKNTWNSKKFRTQKIYLHRNWKNIWKAIWKIFQTRTRIKKFGIQTSLTISFSSTANLFINSSKAFRFGRKINFQRKVYYIWFINNNSAVFGFSLRWILFFV